MMGAIAGDIAGSRLEGRSAPPAGFNLFTSSCRFKDDTVCTLVVADALMRDLDFAVSLKTFVRRHPDSGYGGLFLQRTLSDDTGPYGS